MQLDAEPASLTCAECGDSIPDLGYLPAVLVSEETYQPVPEPPVCGGCGFNDVGFAGCVPELDDVVDAACAADSLLQISVSAGGVAVLSARD